MSKATREEALKLASKFEAQPTEPIDCESELGELVRRNCFVRPWRGWYFIIGETAESAAKKLLGEKS